MDSFETSFHPISVRSWRNVGPHRWKALALPLTCIRLPLPRASSSPFRSSCRRKAWASAHSSRSPLQHTQYGPKTSRQAWQNLLRLLNSNGGDKRKQRRKELRKKSALERANCHPNSRCSSFSRESSTSPLLKKVKKVPFTGWWGHSENKHSQLVWWQIYWTIFSGY